MEQLGEPLWLLLSCGFASIDGRTRDSSLFGGLDDDSGTMESADGKVREGSGAARDFLNRG